MDKALRDELRKATQSIRGLLEKEFSEQLEGIFDILTDGSVLAVPGSHLTPAQRVVREKLLAVLAHKQANGISPAAAVGAYVREAAFTLLNRIVGLKMLEARGLVQECVSRGDESSGFKEFTALAPGLVQLPDKGYRLYIDSIFDEIGQEVRVLFDRRDVASLVWPRRAALLSLLDSVNSLELKTVWSEDETIGWVYQYSNDEDERKRMRTESSAPRNSRELAVRNQFFTPRYVVEFLTDNALGRIWYEMTKGNTKLKVACRYMMRRPYEHFLEFEEIAPDVDSSTQEQPTNVTHRALKDPRDLKMLDPACGSMHFGLYAFDLFLTIYEEAWSLKPKPSEGMQALQDEYPSKEAYLRDVPRLILAHNIHGIDIDARAAQIAGFALWLRAQKVWQQVGIPPAKRPRITHSNVVCAEPMPGEEAYLQDFISSHFSATAELRLIGQLAQRIFEAMKLAGEAGSLLKIEQKISEAVTEARKKWLEEPEWLQDNLFGTVARKPKQLSLDVSGIDDELFWENAEERIYAALRAYSEGAVSQSYQQRLFAGDAARGFAYIDLCRKRFDVVLMNPPFGEFTQGYKQQARLDYPNSYNDILGAFVDRFLGVLWPHGRLGAITSRTCFFLTSFKDWRKEVVLSQSSIEVIADLGMGVMDDAMVEAAAYVLERNQTRPSFSVIRSIADEDRKKVIDSCVLAYQQGKSEPRLFLAEQKTFEKIPDSPFVYWVEKDLIKKLTGKKTQYSDIGDVNVGLSTADNPRFVRLSWEIRPHDHYFCYYPSGKDYCDLDDPVVLRHLARKSIGNSKWSFFVMSGASQPWFAPLTAMVNWGGNGDELRNFVDQKGKRRATIRNPSYYSRPGFSWTRRAVRFYPYIIPGNCIHSASRYMAFPERGREVEAIGISASRTATAFMRFYAEFWQRPNFLVDNVKILPWPILTDETQEYLHKLINAEVQKRREAYQNFEPFHEFVLPVKVRDFTQAGKALAFEATSLLGEEGERLVADSYGLSPAQAVALERDLREAIAYQRGDTNEGQTDDEEDDDGEGDEFALDASPKAVEEAHISYLVGCAFGRWDIRFATGEKAPEKAADPFAPLPVCPPGMLQSEIGLPAERVDVPNDYPLSVAWSGVMVDDEGHENDLVDRLRQTLRVIWGERADDQEEESCALLGVDTLAEYLRRSTGFFADHLKRYTKSSRKAPVYWQLATRGSTYSIWLYYHRLDRDTFFQVLEVVKAKVEHESSKLHNMELESGPNPSSTQRKLTAGQELLVQELRTMRDEVTRIAPLWNPNFDDGVIINHALLWRLVPHNNSWQKECRASWEKLVDGDSDWTHLAMHLWPERVVPKCAVDRGLAFAHGLEHVFWRQNEQGKWERVPVTVEAIQNLINQRSSAAVKAALQSVLDAPTSRGGARTRASSPRPTGLVRDNVTKPTTPIVVKPFTEVDEKKINLVRLAILASAEGLSKADVFKTTGLDDSDWLKVISALLDSGEVIRSGEKRGTRYHAGSTEKTDNE